MLGRTISSRTYLKLDLLDQYHIGFNLKLKKKLKQNNLAKIINRSDLFY